MRSAMLRAKLSALLPRRFGIVPRCGPARPLHCALLLRSPTAENSVSCLSVTFRIPVIDNVFQQLVDTGDVRGISDRFGPNGRLGVALSVVNTHFKNVALVILRDALGVAALVVLVAEFRV